MGIEKHEIKDTDEQPKETPEQAEMTKQLQQMADTELKREADALAQKQREKTFIESTFSEYQTRESKVRGTEIKRGEAFRYERGQIFKAYMNLRQEIREAEARGEKVVVKKRLLIRMRERARVIEKDLDELNRQYYENARDVEIETPDGTFTVPVVELDLKKAKEGEDYDATKDDRIPEVFLTGAVSNYHQTACYTMARALQGHRVLVPMTPEQPSVKKPENFSQVLKQKGNLEPYADIVKALVKKMELEEFNLSGWSMGATVALEMASDPELEGLHDLTVMEPLGLQDKGFLRMGWEFAVGQGLKTVTSSEKKIKSLDQGAQDSQAGLSALVNAGSILARKHFDSQKLSRINPGGRFQVLMGAQSPIMNGNIIKDVFKKTEALRIQKDSEASPLEFYTVEGKETGADHSFPMVNALGLSRMVDGEPPKSQFSTVTNKALGNSAVEWMLKDIAQGK